MQIHAAPELKAYLQEPFQIANHQCLVHANNRLVEISKDVVNYYDLDLTGYTNYNLIKKDTLIEVKESTPCDVLKQLSFYKKCKSLSITKEAYDYIEKLGKNIANVDAMESIAKPAISKCSSNCKYITMPWSITVNSRRINGKSVCLVATKDIQPKSTFLFEQKNEHMQQTKKKLFSKYPIMFVFKDYTLVPNDTFDAPVKIQDQLVNFTTVKNKRKHCISFAHDFQANYSKNKNNAKRRRFFLKKHGETFVIEKVENPTHLK